VRGTLTGIEVERWGGEQAHRWVESLKPHQDFHTSDKELSRPASALVLFAFFSFDPSPNKLDHNVLRSSSYDLLLGWSRELEGSSLAVRTHKTTARSCVEPRGPSSGRNHVRQSFSRLRLIAPRLTLRSGSHLQPCLVAPTIDSASLEHPDSATETAPAPFARWLHKSESPTRTDLSRLTPPPPLISLITGSQESMSPDAPHQAGGGKMPLPARS
jgi:hypothetical protein